MPTRTLKTSLLGLVNRVGSLLPKRLQRAIVDFPGVLRILGKLGDNSELVLRSPEGYSIYVNPLFHANLAEKGGLGDYEPEMRAALERLAQPGHTAYDIGANVGVFSFLLLARVGPAGRVFAFEPEVNNHRYLERSISEIDSTNLVLDTRAIGNHVGVVEFDRRGGAFSGRLVGDQPNYDPTDNVVEVEATTLDVLVYEEQLPKPDIVKIDVEGNEVLVLAGMQRLLRERPPIVVCEIHRHLGDAVDSVGETLRERGYRIYDLKAFLDRPESELEQAADLSALHQVVALPPAATRP